MENASKALIMAGSILMSIIIISLLVLTYNRISSFQQAQTDAEEISKQEKYMKNIESYNKDIYGSELLSLANLLDDYNTNQADTKGYTRITVEVNLKTKIQGENKNSTIEVGEHAIKDVRNTIINLQYEIEDYETNEEEYNNISRTIKQWSQMSNLEIIQLLNIKDAKDTDALYDILCVKSSYSKLYEKIQKYIELKTVQTQFKSTIFEIKETQYDDIGRLKYMLFEEYKNY